MVDFEINKGVGREVEFKGAHVMVHWQIRQ